MTTIALQFGDNISADQLWFLRAGNALEVSLLGSSDKATIADWYAGRSCQIERFQTADGKLLVSEAECQSSSTVNLLLLANGTSFRYHSSHETQTPKNS